MESFKSVEIRIERPDIAVYKMGAESACLVGQQAYDIINQLNSEELEILARYALSRASVLDEESDHFAKASRLRRMLNSANTEQFNPEAMQKGGEDA